MKCTDKEWQHCRVEKMGCPGCYYDEAEKEKLFYIFLDIDGVLNNMEYWNECFERHQVKGIMSMNCFPFDPKCLNNLMKLSQELQKQNYVVKIVLSSTWRLNQMDIGIVNSRLAEYGMRIFATTISLSSGKRGLEIKDFLEDEQYGKADNYLILDDEIKDIAEQFEEKHIIHTNFNTGFNNEKLEEAMKKLNSFEQ
jgi:hypothetical protein